MKNREYDYLFKLVIIGNSNVGKSSILMRFSDRNLHNTSRKILARTLPPLLTLEKLLFSCVTSGFILLSAALVTGIVFSEQMNGALLTLSHKTIFALASWAIFGTLLIGRVRYGWRGRFAANWALAGFSLLFLGYIGTRIALEVFLHKGQRKIPSQEKPTNLVFNTL